MADHLIVNPAHVHGVRALLRKYGIYPKKRYGQNFLLSENAVRSVLDTLNLQSSDSVVEIGAGAGALTSSLVEMVGCVVAVEIDLQLVALLEGELGNRRNLTVLSADVLGIELHDAVGNHCQADSYKVAGNLPYYITSRILRRLLESKVKPELIVVMVQREVGQRAVASPPDMSLLAVSVQYYSEAELVYSVPSTAFYPPPEVESVVLKLTPRRMPLFPDIGEERFFQVASAGFGQKRKTLLNSLSSNLTLTKEAVRNWLKAGQIPEKARAEELSLEEWAELCRKYPEN